ncbi:MAG: ACP S-malonyltransferase [Steroidobacteraceae bacterium]
MSFAFVFPGQGSQSVGMLRALEADADVRATFAEASEALGFDLWALAQAGPADRLNATENAQPALLTAGVAIFRLWRRRGGGEPLAVSGHSLGEFTALVAAQALDFRAAVDLVRIRGRLMQEAVPEGAGAMVAILGLDDAQVAQACRVAAEGAVVEPVNFNAPGQVVVAGESAAVERALEAAKRLGAKRVVPIPVSVPAHSSLMRPAAERLAARLEGLPITRPRYTYVSAVDAEAHADPAEIRRLLVRQLLSPVRWRETVRALEERGIGELIECGPGRVLSGLNRRIASRPGLKCLSIEDAASIDAALAASGASGASAVGG